MKKFNKNREVDHNWLNIPIKYILRTTGSNTGSNDKYVTLPIEEQYENYLKWNKEFDWLENEPMTFDEYKDYLKKYPDSNETIYVPAKHNKTFCIIELSKHWATCGWRNNDTCSIGMPIKCRIVKKNKHIGIIYKDKFYPIDDSSGWVF